MAYNVKVLKSYRRMSDKQFLHRLMYITLIECIIDSDIFLAQNLINDYKKKFLKETK
jgi:hypothetical protein